MKDLVVNSTNLFLVSAEILWKQGEDGEVIARELAHALKHVIIEGAIKGTNESTGEMEAVLREVERLMKE